MTTTTTTRELTWATDLREGSKGPDVRRLQEWLQLRGMTVSLDGEFGPKTRAAVERFQMGQGMATTGVADVGGTLRALVKPMYDATDVVHLEPGASVAEYVVAHALRHLAAGPRELDAPNTGPWVRLYMNGRDGEDRPWCAGFISFVVKQAFAAVGGTVPFPLSLGCSELARAAQRVRRYHCGRATGDVDLTGAIFVVPGKQEGKDPHDAPHVNSWSHTGIVSARNGDNVSVIEGNTNVAGSREGTHVKARTRPLASVDYLIIR